MGSSSSKAKKTEETKITVKDLQILLDSSLIKCKQFHIEKSAEIILQKDDIIQSIKENDLFVVLEKTDKLLINEDYIYIYDNMSKIIETLNKNCKDIISNKECPKKLRSDLDTILYASNRIEILELCQFKDKIIELYGVTYVYNAEDNKDGYVNKDLMEKLKEKNYSIKTVNERIKQLCEEKQIDYKSMSEQQTGKKNCRIEEKDGKAKEYNSEDKLVFEGDFSNGERNGKGKEYNEDGSLKYEGEYLNGKKNGKGKEYYEGKLIFEGDYLNGELQGKGKEYYENGQLRFEGEYSDNQKCGKGKEYFENGKIKFEGDYLNGDRWNGKGYNIKGINYFEIKYGKGKEKDIEAYKGYLIFEGEYFLNGILKVQNYFNTESLLDKWDGKLMEYQNGELIFEGDYLNGKRWNGKGKEYFKNKLLFEGEYLNGEKNGKGKEYDFRDGKLRFDGEFLDGKKWDGKWYSDNNSKECEIKNGNGNESVDEECLNYEKLLEEFLSTF